MTESSGELADRVTLDTMTAARFYEAGKPLRVERADTISQAVASLAIGGRAVICGLGAEPITAQPPTVFVRRELQILGSYGFTISTVRRVLALVDAGVLDLDDSITHTFGLDEADRALQTLHEKLGDPQRVVVVP